LVVDEAKIQNADSLLLLVASVKVPSLFRPPELKVPQPRNILVGSSSDAWRPTADWTCQYGGRQAQGTQFAERRQLKFQWKQRSHQAHRKAAPGLAAQLGND